ncbi:hypothetical protein [Rhodococcus rhodochrous]|uniref:hypothetical protein n=1 Tax=Rhodococcus rhodochrous TaxID=1829 RepID=UPI000A6E452B|nr:hypothetical protein [Rhodococcus rhodochrous]
MDGEGDGDGAIDDRCRLQGQRHRHQGSGGGQVDAGEQQALRLDVDPAAGDVGGHLHRRVERGGPQPVRHRNGEGRGVAVAAEGDGVAESQRLRAEDDVAGRVDGVLRGGRSRGQHGQRGEGGDEEGVSGAANCLGRHVGNFTVVRYGMWDKWGNTALG